MAKTHFDQGREDFEYSEELLSAYLEKTLQPEERASFEKQLAEDPFLADALEGLNESDPETVSRSVQILKKQLRHQIRKKERGKHRQTGVDISSYWAIAIILILVVAAFLVLQFLKHKS